MLNKWLEDCELRANAIENIKQAMVYTLHFERNDYTQNNSKARTKRRKTAVPSVQLNKSELNMDMNASAASANDSEEEIMDSSKRSHQKCIVCGGSDLQRKYHSIPSNPFMRNKWLDACGLQASAIESMKRPMVCTLHFERNDYTQNNSKARTRLQKTAVPSLRLNESEWNVDMNASTANTEDDSSAANADDNGEEIIDSNKRCHTRCIVCGGKDLQRKYHSIPSNPFMRNKWLEACGLQGSGIENMKQPVVCSLHFERNDYTQKNSKARTKLRKTAVPSLQLNESEWNVDMSASAANADDNGEEIMDSSKRCHMKCIVCGGNDSQRKYHSIPSNPFMRNKWLEACGLQASAIENMKRPMVCTLHFKRNDYIQNNSKIRQNLRKTAVPSLQLKWTCMNSIKDEDEAMEEDKYIYCVETISDIPDNEDMKVDNNEPKDTEECTDEDVLESFVLINTSNSRLPLHEDVTLTPTSNVYNPSYPPAVHAIIDAESVTRIPVSSPPATAEVGGIMSTPKSTPKRKCQEKLDERGILLWRYAADIGWKHCQTPEQALRAVDLLKSIIGDQKKIIAALRKKVHRQTHRITSLKGVLTGLKNKKLLSKSSQVQMVELQ